MPIPLRRALPTLFVSNDEYAILHEMSTDEEITITELLKDLILSAAEIHNTFTVVHIPNDLYSTFVAFFDEGEADSAIVRCLQADADDFKHALLSAVATEGREGREGE